MHSKMQIIRASHNFTVRNPGPQVKGLIYQFASQYTQMNMEYDPLKRKRVWKPFKTFGIHVGDGSEYRFHIGQWEEFWLRFRNLYIPEHLYQIIDLPMYEGDKIEIDINGGWKLRDYQQEGEEFVFKGLEEGFRRPLFYMAMGKGKAQPLDARIKIPGGWTSMGHLRINDELLATDGSTTYVTGVFPQGYKSVYRVEFEDGRSTRCCLNHLWSVYVGRSRTPEVVETAELIALLRSEFNQCYVELPVPEDGPAKQFLVDPYELGRYLVLGLGSRKVAPRHLAELGLINLAPLNRFVPSHYFHGSADQRLSLLQGLMDVGGLVAEKDNEIVFSTASRKLARSVKYLVRSLGGLARLQSFAFAKTHTVSIRIAEPERLFLDANKRALAARIHFTESQLRLWVKSITYVGKEVVQCISVAHPNHLYITDDFIPTHNTKSALHVVHRVGERFFILVLAKYVAKWVQDIQDNLKIQAKEIAVIEGSKSLRGCTFFPGSGLPMPKAFVASIETMGVWWKQYEEDPYSDFLKEEFGCKPYELFKHLGVGTVINDEAHQHPHAVYKAHCYTHTPLLLSLSATMLSKDPVIRRVQSIMFPIDRRYVIPMDQYINAHACCYQILDFDNSRVKISERGQTSYSHTAFEKSILHHHALKEQYAKMILDLIDCTYFDDYIKGDRAIVFVSTVNMAQLLTALAKKRWPKLDIRTYLQDDPYENVLEPDIRFTTVIGAGTAVDIENLRHAYMTQALDSPNAMAQALGRLRELPDRDVHFHHLYCSSIQKHVQYTENTAGLFKSLVKSHGRNFLVSLKP